MGFLGQWQKAFYRFYGKVALEKRWRVLHNFFILSYRLVCNRDGNKAATVRKYLSDKKLDFNIAGDIVCFQRFSVSYIKKYNLSAINGNARISVLYSFGFLRIFNTVAVSQLLFIKNFFFAVRVGCAGKLCNKRFLRTFHNHCQCHARRPINIGDIDLPVQVVQIVLQIVNNITIGTSWMLQKIFSAFCSIFVFVRFGLVCSGFLRPQNTHQIGIQRRFCECFIRPDRSH